MKATAKGFWKYAGSFKKSIKLDTAFTNWLTEQNIPFAEATDIWKQVFAEVEGIFKKAGDVEVTYKGDPADVKNMVNTDPNAVATDPTAIPADPNAVNIVPETELPPAEEVESSAEEKQDALVDMLNQGGKGQAPVAPTEEVPPLTETPAEEAFSPEGVPK